MIHELHRAILLWQNKHYGKMPARVLVSPFVMERLEEDAETLSLKHDPKEIGGFKIAGVLVESNDSVFFAQVVP